MIYFVGCILYEKIWWFMIALLTLAILFHSTGCCIFWDSADSPSMDCEIPIFINHTITQSPKIVYSHFWNLQNLLYPKILVTITTQLINQQEFRTHSDPKKSSMFFR